MDTTPNHTQPQSRLRTQTIVSERGARRLDTVELPRRNPDERPYDGATVEPVDATVKKLHTPEELRAEPNYPLWVRLRGGDRTAKDDLVVRYAPLVKYAIGRLAISLPAAMDTDDVLSGTVGLLHAMDRYTTPIRAFALKPMPDRGVAIHGVQRPTVPALKDRPYPWRLAGAGSLGGADGVTTGRSRRRDRPWCIRRSGWVARLLRWLCGSS